MFEAASQAIKFPHDDHVSFTLLAKTHHFVQGWTGLATAAGPVHKRATQLPAAAGSIFTQLRQLHLRILPVCRANASVQDGSHSNNPFAGNGLSATITAPTISGKIHSVNNCFSNASYHGYPSIHCPLSGNGGRAVDSEKIYPDDDQFRLRERVGLLQVDAAEFDSVRDYWERTQGGVSVSIAHVIKTCAFIRKIASGNIGEPVVTFDQLWAGQRIDQLAPDSHRVAEKAINCVELVAVGPELRHVDVSAERPDD